MKHYLRLSVGVVFLATAASTYADVGGGMDTGGVDAIAARRLQIQTLVMGNGVMRGGGMQGDIQAYLTSVNPEALNTEGAKHIRDLIEAGLAEDVRRTTYSLREECRNHAGQVVAASTQVRTIGAEVCINLAQLSSQPVVPAEIYSFVLHEHAHHLGADASPAGELLASAQGNAMGPQVAAFRFFHPRPEFLSGQNPVIERPTAECLNIVSLYDRWVGSGGFVTMYTQDVETFSSDSVGDTAAWFPVAFGNLYRSTAPTQRFAGRPGSVYQIGCEAVMIDTGNGVYMRGPIIAYGPTFIEFTHEYDHTFNGVQKKFGFAQKFTANYGQFSEEITFENTMRQRYALNCERIDNRQWVEASSAIVKTISRANLIHHPERRPADSQLVGISLRFMDLAQQNPRATLDLATGNFPRGARPEDQLYHTCSLLPEALLLE